MKEEELKATFRDSLFTRVGDHLNQIQKDRASQGMKGLVYREKKEIENLDIGIVGGGMAGLYAGLLLQELGIKFHIFEASGERLGGRVRTHYFNNVPHSYAELGAMRFPKNVLQDRLFKFWDYLNETLKDGKQRKEIPKIPYILHDPNPDLKSGNLLFFNNMKPVTINEVRKDNSLLGFDQFFEGPDWDYFKKSDGKLKPAQTLLDASIKPFIEHFQNDDIDKAWEELLKYDQFSARAYMQQEGDKVLAYPSKIVDYIESVLTYSGIYDLAFIELVLDQFSFSSTKEWKAMDGGTSRITDEMAKRIPIKQITLGAQVYRLEESKEAATVHYHKGEGMLTEHQTFDRVIETLPFSVLKFMDTPDWTADKREAMRMFKMTNSVKVALGFKSRFWEKPGPFSEGMKGGQSDTDLNVRSIVYPSFGIGHLGPGYILGSYCWQNDADKFSHLNENQIFEAVLRDVAKLHGDIVYKEYLGHGASVVWNREKLAGGAFEFFGSGQFGEMLIAGSEPEGRFHFAGEHLDMVHYWIVGAFNSAFRTVWEILILEGLDSEKNLNTLRNALGGGKIFPTMIPQI